MASWSSGNAFVSGTASPRYKSRAVQIKIGVANGSPLLPYFFKKALLPGRNVPEMDPANESNVSEKYSEYEEDLI